MNKKRTQKGFPILIVLILCILLLGCKRESPVNEARPLLRTTEVSVNKGDNGAVIFSGEFVVPGRYSSIQYGFSLDTVKELAGVLNIRVGTEHEPTTFQARVQMALRPGTTYYARSWAKTARYEVFGNAIPFQCDGTANPVIDKITPSVALWGDTIIVTGKNFDYFGKNNLVRFNDVPAVKSWGSGDTIWTIIPFVQGIQDYNLSVTVSAFNNVTKVGVPLKIAAPLISRISAAEGEYPDTLIVTGDNFTRIGTQLLINGVADSIIALNEKSFSFVVPFFKVDQFTKIELRDRNKNYTIAENFHYHGQSFSDWQKTAWIGDTIKVYAKNIDFRRIMLDIKDTDPHQVQYYLERQTITHQWKDSLAFVLSGNYPQPTFNLNIFFGNNSWFAPPESHFMAGQIEIGHRKPVILSLQKEGAYEQPLSITGKGTYWTADNQGTLVTSLDGTIRVTSASSIISSIKSIIPGNYQAQLYSNDRYSEPAYFTVKPPVIATVTPVSFYPDQKLQVTGTYLPHYGVYRFISKESGRVFSQRAYNMPNAAYTEQQVDPMGIVGAGAYEMELKIGEISYKFPGGVEVKDHFSYVTKLLNPLPFAYSVGCGFSVNNRIYIPQNSGMSIIELETGNVRTKDGDYNYDHQPLFFGNKIYLNVFKGSRFVLCTFNELTEDWDEVNMDGVPVGSPAGTVGIFDNHLILVTNGGDLYQYDQKWTFLSHIDFNLYFIHYIHSGNGLLYFCDFYQGKIVVVSTADWKIIRNLKIPVSYENSLRYIFELNNELYLFGSPAGYGSNLFYCYKFTTSETFEKLNPFQLSFDPYNHFCPDGKGNVYFENQDYIYKFNP